MQLHEMKLGIAAGPVKTLEELQKALRGKPDFVTIGSITSQPRGGNRGETYWEGDDGLTINSWGMPNRGLPYYEQCLPEMFNLAGQAGTQLSVSVAGFSPEEFGRLAYSVFRAGITRIQFNFGCPNIHGSSGQKRIFSFHPLLIRESVQSAAERIGDQSWVAELKLSLYSDPELLERVAREINGLSHEYPNISFVLVLSNTFPNCLRYDAFGRSVIRARSADETMIFVGGGSGGPLMLAMVLGQVQSFASLCDGMPIIATGGIQSGYDVREAMCAGATGCGFASAYLRSGESPKLFQDIRHQIVYDLVV